jgi:hypothetical protein
MREKLAGTPQAGGQNQVARFVQTPQVVRRHPTYSTLVSGSAFEP